MTRVEKQSLSISTGISSVPIGVGGKVHVWGRNDMADNQKLGIHWIVKDPDGLVPINGDYEDWEFGDTGPGDTHEFISSGRFDLNKAGTWTIGIGLSMNPDSPVVVASYTGVLCVVISLAGTIVKKELEYDETRGDIPVL